MNLEEWKNRNQRSRNYSHFDLRVSLYKVWSYISDPAKVASHGFYPFISHTLTTRKYRKNEGVKNKNRNICYSAHVDRYIYSYYGFLLNKIYNGRILQDGLNDSVIAYRSNLRKNNLHFAKLAIDFIKESEECFILIGDFTGFFDSLDHGYLKGMLCSLLDVSKLPDDYYAVFKNITKYSMWDLESLLTLNNLDNTEKGISAFKNLKLAISYDQFKKLKKNHVKPNREKFGIPQGSAISAVLSNIYMLQFDNTMKDFVEEKQGLYMRYSDDFIIVLPKRSLNQFENDINTIHSLIRTVPRLELENDKTQVFKYTNGQVTNCNKDILGTEENGKHFINYLGLTFDGQTVTLRDKTISKYYYKLNRKLKTIVKRNGFTPSGKRISCKNVYTKYSIKGSHIGRGNFITYVQRAEQIFGNNEDVARVKKMHLQKIKRKLNEMK